MRKTSSLLLALGIFSATAATAQGTLSNGLMAYYPFTGSTQDVSGNNRHLFNGGATPAISKNGTPNAAYAFDGVSSYMQLSANAGIDFVGDFSVCMQVKPTGYFQGSCHGNMLLIKSFSPNDPNGMLIQYEDGYYTGGNNCSNPTVDTVHQTFYLGKTNMGSWWATGNVANPPYATSNIWRSLVVMSKGDSLYQYIDGVLTNSVYAPSFTSPNSFDIFVGKTNNTTNTYYFNGVMDELRIYNRALTLEEVIQYGNYDPQAVKETSVATAMVGISPNPAVDVLRLTNSSSQSLSFRVLNLQGVEVARGMAKAGDTEIPVSELASGMYLLQLQGDKAATQTLRFVKQ